MKMEIDFTEKKMILNYKGLKKEINLYSKQAFHELSRLWLKVGWNEKYPYTFSWLGRPLIQQPEDVLRIQEVIYRLRPDVIIETGIAHGGSLVFYSSLCKAIGNGRVIGIDIEIRKYNRKAIEEHELNEYIQMIEGSSVDKYVVNQVAAQLKSGESVMVILDSNHSKAHVKEELELYSKFVSVNSYIVATDGSMEFLYDVPRGKETWEHDNPCSAVREFILEHPEFILEQPKWPFNESQLSENVTHWPNAWLKRVSV